MAEPMRSEMLPEDRSASLASLLGGMLDQEARASLSGAQGAHAVWFACNGDREREHTTKVFLRQARAQGAAPILCVRVDSHALVTDFSANRDLYLGRLANWGYAVSGIEFSVDRDAVRTRHATPDAPVQDVPTHEVQTFSAEEAEEVARLVSGLPEPLRSSVSKAIAQSMGGTETF